MNQPETIEEALTLLNDILNSNNLTTGFTNGSIGHFLGKSKDPKVFAPLIDALKRGNEYIRADVALGLGYLGNKDAIPYLLDTFLNDVGIYVRSDAAIGLGLLRAEIALPFFIERFPQENFEVQKRIIIGISLIATLQAKQ